MNKRKVVVSFLLFLVMLTSVIVCLANDKDSRIDLRKTRIARVSFLEGAASLQRQSTDSWDGAALNVPVFPGDLVHSTKDSRLELELYGGFIRMSENTSLGLVEFTPKLYRFDLSVGLTTFSFGDDRPQIEIATPQVAVKFKKAGIYRINVQLDGTTEVTVREGEVELFSKTDSFKLKKDKRAVFPNNSSSVSFTQALNTDDWDSWNNQRELLVSINSVNGYFKPRPYLYGSSTLSQYGQWLNVASYGFVWKPNNVGVGWSPYTIGRWAYYKTSGWTWISQEAWGWLPYHYGYWACLDAYGWVWVPNSLNWYWSPALVSWYYGNWNGNSYICWHPWNSNNGWNGDGGWGGSGSAQESTKEKAIQNALNSPKIVKPIVVGLPVSTFTSGNGVVSGKNISPEITITKTLNINEVSHPKVQGLTTSIAPVGIQEVISRPLVTHIAANPENSNTHHKYELAKENTLNNIGNVYNNDQKTTSVFSADSVNPSSGKSITINQTETILPPTLTISPSSPEKIK